MNIGKLDRLITIQQDTGSDSTGEHVPSWETYRQVWAGIKPKSGSERYEAEMLTATNQVIFVIRYDSGVTEAMRISYESEIYDIIHIAEAGRRQYQELTAQKKDRSTA